MGRDICVIVATYNRANALERLLEALLRQSLSPSDWEVVVAVDGSTDGTTERLDGWTRRGELPLRYFRQPNAGQSVARHNAILASNAARVIIVDDDVQPCPEFVAAHLEAAAADPARTVVIGKTVPLPDWKRRPLIGAVGEQGMVELHRRLEAGLLAPNATSFVTQNVSVPRAMYLSSGGFDPALRLDEDRELGVRLERAGARFVFAPRAWAVHHTDVGLYAKWFQRQYDYGQYAIKVWNKHDRDPWLHPLRNLVTGSRLNGMLVRAGCPRDGVASRVTTLLRALGELLHALRLHDAAIATHKAILAIQYHRGVRDAIGSWKELKVWERRYRALDDRPRAPTGAGETMRPGQADVR